MFYIVDQALKCFVFLGCLFIFLFNAAYVTSADCYENSSPKTVTCPKPDPVNCDIGATTRVIVWMTGWAIPTYDENYNEKPFPVDLGLPTTMPSCSGKVASSSSGDFALNAPANGYAKQGSDAQCYQYYNCAWGEKYGPMTIIHTQCIF